MVLHGFRWLCLLVLPVLAMLPATATALDFVLAGSTTAQGLASDLAAQLRQTAGMALTLEMHGSESGIEAVRAGRADAAIVSRPLTASERRQLNATPFAMDRLVLIVNERNRMSSISAATVRDIFSRSVSDWTQVRTGDIGAIVPVTRRATHSTRTRFDQIFGIGRVVPTGIVELGSNLATVLYVGADPQAIGYVSAGAYDDARRRGLRIKALPLSDMAGAESCADDHSGLCRPLSLVRRQGAMPRGFASVRDALLGTSGRALIERQGFLPVAAP